MGERPACGKTTQDLLLEFQQTGCQEPFEEIARRYAGMVYNVALQVTRDAHDAEDATQATFLSLAVHAKTAGKIRFVGPWLRKVSQRLALDIRRSKKRRTTREQRHAITRAAGNGNGDGTVSRHDLAIANSLQLEELRDILRNELDRLPTKYRMPLILYYFGGLTPEQIGRELKCKTSTLGVRLHRGRKMLAENLSNRGISINSTTAGIMLAALVDTSIRDNLVHACTHAAVQVTNGHFVADVTVSAPVMAMVQGITRTIRLSRLKGIIAALALVLTAITGTAKALERLEILNPELIQRINPLRLLGPLMDRLVRPSFSLEAPAPGGSNDLLTLETSIAATATPYSLALGPGTWPALPHTVTGATAHVGSERVLASQYHPLDGAAMPGPMIVATSPQPVYAPPASPLIPPAGAGRLEAEALPLIAPLALAETTAAPVIPPAPFSTTPTRTFDSLVIDRAGSSDPSLAPGGVFRFSRGSMHARRLVVGQGTDGVFVHDGGSVQVDEEVVIGNQPSGSGTYTISNNATLTTPKLVVGGAGTGAVFQSGGQVAATTPGSTGQVVLGDQAGSEGAYLLAGGSLVADRLIIGRLGTGTLQQTGGDLQFQMVQLGAELGGRGTWALSDGVVQISDPTSPGYDGGGLQVSGPAVTTGVGAGLQVSGPAVTTGVGAGLQVSGPAVAVNSLAGSQGSTPVVPASVDSGTPGSGGVPSFTTAPIIKVGGEGVGTILLRPSSEPAIQEQTGTRGATLVLQPNSSGTGVIRGWGQVALTGPFIANGKVIADGFGEGRMLDLSSVSIITNTLDNPEDGQNGWRARNGGSLKLPPLRLYGAGEYTWGEFLYDRQLDLVNSVRLTIPGDARGQIQITLLDPLSEVVPLLETGGHGIGLWEIDGTVDLSGIDLLIRYDHAMVGMWRESESNLVIWAFEDGQWQILSEMAGIDTSANLIWARANNLEYFAVGLGPDNLPAQSALVPAGVTVTPEPMGLTALGLVGAILLLRRRR